MKPDSVRLGIEIFGALGLIVSGGMNYQQSQAQQQLETDKVRLEVDKQRLEQREGLYSSQKEQIWAHLEKVRLTTDRALSYLDQEKPSVVKASELRRECEALEQDRLQLVEAIRARESNYREQFEPDFKVTSEEHLGSIGKPTCLNTVKLLIAEKMVEIVNVLEPYDPEVAATDTAEPFFRFVDGVSERWLEVEVGDEWAGANIRSEPGKQPDNVVLTVLPGSKLRVVGLAKGSGWIKVRPISSGGQVAASGGNVGWIWKGLVKVPADSLLASMPA